MKRQVSLLEVCASIPHKEWGETTIETTRKVEELKYLESIIQRNGDSDVEVKYRVEAGLVEKMTRIRCHRRLQVKIKGCATGDDLLTGDSSADNEAGNGTGS